MVSCMFTGLREKQTQADTCCLADICAFSYSMFTMKKQGQRSFSMDHNFHGKCHGNFASSCHELAVDSSRFSSLWSTATLKLSHFDVPVSITLFHCYLCSSVLKHCSDRIKMSFQNKFRVTCSS